MTIKKKNKSIFFSFKSNDETSKKFDRKFSFPDNYMLEDDCNIHVFLHNFSEFTTLEKNYFMILIGMKLFNFSKNFNFSISNLNDERYLANVTLGWKLGQYKFEKFKSKKILNNKDKNLQVSKNVKDLADVIFLVRDLINTPANLLGPKEINDIANDQFKKIVNSKKIYQSSVLKKKFPLIYEVGKGANELKQPILSEFNWRNKKRGKKKKIIIIGKGVSFDTGGLNLKLGSGMSLMKKDMGGAANCIGLSKLLIHEDTNVDLKLLLCLVENSVSSKSMRPSDIVKSRKGTFVEIKDTDAEGRLIMADALAYACEFNPDLIIDLATLTGASRVALGQEVPSFFCNDKFISQKLIKSSEAVGDPLWELPLWKNYTSLLKSQHADISNISSGPFGGAITAALFLEEFVSKNIPWIHIDMMAWTNGNSFCSYQGGEAMGIRALSHFLKEISK